MVTCYPTPGKDKARRICEAFAEGVRAAGGEAVVADPLPEKLGPGAAFFYGVTEATRGLWDEARAEGRTWFYADNAYFDRCRGTYFRVTKNRLQHEGRGESDGARLRALMSQGLVSAPKPWKPGGSYIIVAPQSDLFMRVCAGYPGNWVMDILAALRAVTTRTVSCRPWTADKVDQYKSLHRDLPHAWAVVAWSSGCALSGLLEGVPAVVLAEDCISRPVAFTDLRDIEKRPNGDDRRGEWMKVVADHQWTLDELREGVAWRALNQ